MVKGKLIVAAIFTTMSLTITACAGTGYVTAVSGLNVRTAPEGDKVTALPYGTAVKVIEESGDWSTITIDNNIYYVASAYIGEENAISSGGDYAGAFARMSGEEYDLMARILALEAQTEPFEGQVAVVEVIMNRVLSGHFPNTIYGVLSDKGEFATWKYLSHPYNTPIQEQYDAINHVMANGRTVLPADDYVYFSTGKQSYAKDYIKIGHHWFGRYM